MVNFLENFVPQHKQSFSIFLLFMKLETFSNHSPNPRGKNSLLAGFVILQGQFLDQVVGIVVGRLHRHHAGGMLGLCGTFNANVWKELSARLHRHHAGGMLGCRCVE